MLRLPQAGGSVCDCFDLSAASVLCFLLVLGVGVRDLEQIGPRRVQLDLVLAPEGSCGLPVPLFLVLRLVEHLCTCVALELLGPARLPRRELENVP